MATTGAPTLGEGATDTLAEMLAEATDDGMLLVDDGVARLMVGRLGARMGAARDSGGATRPPVLVRFVSLPDADETKGPAAAAAAWVRGSGDIDLRAAVAAAAGVRPGVGEDNGAVPVARCVAAVLVGWVVLWEETPPLARARGVGEAAAGRCEVAF